MNSLERFLSGKLAARDAEGSRRHLKVTAPQLVDFTSNDYLGLARATDLAAMIRDTTDRFSGPNGATGSRLLSGNHAYTEETEQYLAQRFAAEAALIFNSGYTANLGVLSALPQRDDTILYDELAHACIKDGARLSMARRYSFRHNDLHDLENKLKKSSGKKFIAVESIYSMDGDACPLEDLIALAQQYHAYIILDEAHSTGIWGDGGSGMAVARQLQEHIAVRIYTFGKAMGIHGACVAGSRSLIDYLINFSRPFIYTTALSPHSVAAIRCAFDYIQQHPELAHQLQERIGWFSASIQIPARTHSVSAIQTAWFPGNEKARGAAHNLQQRGFDVRPILAPTVPAGTERLRICLHAYNTQAEIMGLTQALNEMF